MRRIAKGTAVVALVVVGLWPAPLAIPEGVELVRGVTYKAGLAVDIAKPIAGTMRPAVLCIHGGGWTYGHRREVTWLILELARRGYVGVAVSHRFAPRHPYPAAVDDVRDAVRWVAAHAAHYGVDPARIALWGNSSGGHLASLVATTSSGVAAVVSFHGVYDLTGAIPPSPMARQFAEQFLAGSDGAQASPAEHVTPDDPPMLLIHGDADPLADVAHVRRFEERLRRAGVPVETLVLAGAGHVLQGNDSNRAFQAAFDFLERNLR